MSPQPQDQTRGQAMYAAACWRLGLTPGAPGTQKAVVAECSDICTQAQMSEWSRGVREPSDRKLSELGERFGFELVTYWVSKSRWLSSSRSESRTTAPEQEETPGAQ